MEHNLEEFTVTGLHNYLQAEIVAVPRSAVVLDLGCGSGAWLARLRRLGFEDLWGIDVGTPPRVEGYAFIQANLNLVQPDLGQKKFGLITLIEVIEHLENPGPVLSLIAGHLDDGGIAIITTPNIHSLRCRLRFMLTGRLPSFDQKGEPTHITPILLPAFQKVVSRYGLEINHACTYPAKSSLVFSRAVCGAAAMLRPFLADPLPGDSLCLTLRSRKGVA